VVGTVEVDPAILQKPAADLKPKAPGMKYTHYAPNADVVLVRGETEAVVAEINRRVETERYLGLKTGVLATEETKERYEADVVLSLGSRDHLEMIGANLYKYLRKFDFLDVNRVYSEVFPEEGEGMAIMNRLNKAAGYKIIDLDKDE